MAETWKYYSLLKRAFFRALPHNTEDAGTVWSPDLLGFRCQGRKYVWLLVLSSHFPSGWEWDTGEDEQPFPCQRHWNGCLTWCQRHQNSCATGCHLPKWPGKLPVYIGTCAHTLIYFRDHMKNVRFTFSLSLTGGWDRVCVQMHNPQVCLCMAQGKAFSATMANTEIARRGKIRLSSLPKNLNVVPCNLT